MNQNLVDYHQEKEMMHMNEDPNDITNDVYYGKNDPWEQIDSAIGLIRDAFAAIGLFCVIIAFILWFTGKV